MSSSPIPAAAPSPAPARARKRAPRVAVRVDNLGKLYRLGDREHYHMFRDVLTGALRAPLNLFRAAKAAGQRSAERTTEADDTDPQSLWALRNVSFEVAPGEVVGIVGRNGAGKSTLLKILSRITEPTEGVADMFGRLGSLLEVGTGFHQELSGRENIYMNGALLGMRKAEIAAKFDEIVAFSEVEKFIDTPVKRYSSGMYMRLAFAVAAHLDPEILVIDEVLAVGDAAFQKKCLGKMGEVARQGRTVLFVSHNMAAVQSLCNKVVMLEQGRVVEVGDPARVVSRYLQAAAVQQQVSLENRTDRSGDGSIRITSLQITTADNEEVIRTASPLKIVLTYTADRPILHPRFEITLIDQAQTPLFSFNTDLAGGLPETLPAAGTLTCTTAPLPLTDGRVHVRVAAHRGIARADDVEYAANLDVEDFDFYNTGRRQDRSEALCVLANSWKFEPAPTA